MGRWVTMNGRHVYIPDKGEEVPKAKEGATYSKQKRKFEKYDNVSDGHARTGPLSVMTDAQVMDAALKGDLNSIDEMSKRGLGIRDMQNYKNMKKQQPINYRVNKEADIKEQQIARNKAEADKLNGKETVFGKEMRERISSYQDKFLKHRTDDEIAELEKNINTSTKFVGTTEQDQIALAAIRKERESRQSVSRKKK